MHFVDMGEEDLTWVSHHLPFRWYKQAEFGLHIHRLEP